MSDNVIGDLAIQPPIVQAGILVSSFSDGTDAHVTGSFVNNTVVGFDRGIEVQGFVNFYPPLPPVLDLEFVNMLLYNDDDLVRVPLEEISYSLISDGTYAGQQNNFSGVPLLGPNLVLRRGSIGIDRGNNAEAGSQDYLGHPRLLDGDGDGAAIVDVGAYEFVVPEPGSIQLAASVLIGMLVKRRAGNRR